MQKNFRDASRTLQWSRVDAKRIDGNSINMVPVQNLLAPFCCVVAKDTLRHLPLLGCLRKQF